VITKTFCTIAYKQDPIEEVLERLAAIGWDAAEIIGNHIKEKTDAELAELRALAKDRGIGIEVVSPYFWLTQSDELRRESMEIARRTIEQARILGCPKIRTFPDAGPTGIGSDVATEEHWAQAVACLREITSWAPDLKFVVETHGKTLADVPDATLRLLGEVGADNLRINYQVESPGTLLPYYETYRPFLSHVHLHNVDSEGKACALESGVIDLPALFHRLLEDGYRESVAVEYCWKGIPWEWAETSYEFLAKHLEEDPGGG